MASEIANPPLNPNQLVINEEKEYDCRPSSRDNSTIRKIDEKIDEKIARIMVFGLRLVCM